MGIPQSLKDIKQWTYSYAIDDLKRPKHSHYTPGGSLPYLRAKTEADQNRLSFGFYCTLKDDIVIGDIDHLSDPNDPSTIPSLEVAELLVNKEVYSEVSPSGEGVRFVFRLPKVESKSSLRGKVFYTRNPKVDKRECQINFGPPWLRFTGNITPYSSETLGEISFAELDAAFAIKYKSDNLLAEAVGPKGVTQVTPQPDSKIPTLLEFMKAMNNIPLDQSPRIIRSYEKVFGQTYSHYDFWLRIMMSAHDYATKTGTAMDVLQRIVEWSRTDTVAFSSDDDVITKWQSLTDGEDFVSYHTVFAIAHSHSLVWPRPKPLTKGQKEAGITTKEPINTEYVNFLELVQFFDLELHRDAHQPSKMYLSGDTDTIDQFFSTRDTRDYYGKYRGIFDINSLTAGFHIMGQEHGFVGLSHPIVQQHIRDWMYQISNYIDLVKLYFDTPFEDLPESYQDNKEHIHTSTVDYMFACLSIEHLTEDHAKEEALYFKYYRAWLMGMVRNIYWPTANHMGNCVLLLSGREQIRKTSHFRYMLPKFMREERIAFTTHGFSNAGEMRDLIKLAAGNTLLVWDEIEQYLNAETESNFKQLIDSNPTKFIDKYATIETTYKPIAMYAGTSNQREFKLSDTGSRRIFHIPISWCDTDSLDKVCWWRIVNDLKDELSNKMDDPPWLLTETEIEYQATLHSKVTAKTGLEITVMEVFNFMEPCFLQTKLTTVKMNGNPINHPNFLTTKKVVDLIQTHTGGMQVNRAHLTRVLHNLCGRWTATDRGTRNFTKPNMTISRGLCTYGGQHKRWVVPTPANPYENG